MRTPPPPEMTCGFLIQLVFCQKKTMWFIAVEVEQETSTPPPKKILDPPLCLSGEGSENGEKTTICLISKKATLHVQRTFFVHFFALILHDYNEKLPETSWLHVLWRKCTYMFLFTFFLLSLIFTVAASISYFLTAATKFHVIPPTKNVQRARELRYNDYQW